MDVVSSKVKYSPAFNNSREGRKGVKAKLKKERWLLVQYKSGAVFCARCNARKCVHVDDVLRKGLFDRALWRGCLERRGPKGKNAKSKVASALEWE